MPGSFRVSERSLADGGSTIGGWKRPTIMKLCEWAFVFPR
jgi:hypothetical protein